MKKSIRTLVAAGALSAMMAITALASNLTGPFIYRDAALTTQYPAHAQACIEKVITEEGAENTKIIVYVQEVTYNGVTGKITSMTIGNTTKDSTGKGTITFDSVDNDLIADNGAVNVGFTLSYAGHENDVTNVYLDVK